MTTDRATEAPLLSRDLIHQVLLLDPSDIDDLRTAPQTTPSFSDFLHGLNRRINPALAVKCAFREKLVDEMNEQNSVVPLQKLVLELYGAVRSLIPNRRDLHGKVSDSLVKDSVKPSEMLLALMQGARNLSQLESVARADTTIAWLDSASHELNSNTTMASKYNFLVTSTLYLLHKVELCTADKRDFYFTNAVVPHIYSNGISEERKQFAAMFGPTTDSSSLPITRSWINDMLSKDTSIINQRLSLAEMRLYFRKWWVEEILFRSASDGQLRLPEVFSLDGNEIRSIRNTIKQAVAGSSIALHAATSAKQSSQVLAVKIDPISSLGLRREDLVNVMSNRAGHVSNSDYERDIQDAAVALARIWSDDLSDDEGLRNRTLAVLQSKDPVVALLNRRVKGIVSSLVAEERNLPTCMTTGTRHESKQLHLGYESSTVPKASHEAVADEFVRQGLTFYASELATATERVRKVVDLTWQIHEDFLVRLFEECSSSADDKDL